jgi:hypothetical protein
MRNGRYVTSAGSTVDIRGQHSGIAEVHFDWLEEGGCIDCHVNAYPETDGEGLYLTWNCETCGGGRAELKETREKTEAHS